MFKITDEIINESKIELEKRKKIFPYDMLGRSLASNPFFPKEVKKNLQRSNNEIKFMPIIKEEKEEKLLQQALDLEKDKANCALCIELQPQNLQNLSLIRRYLKLPLLNKQLIFDEYQILESLVYGADFILLSAKFLNLKELKRLLEFTRYLGLEALVLISDKEDLSKAIFAGADILGIYFLQTFNEVSYKKIISLIPNSKIILACNMIEKNEIEKYQNLGIDVFCKDK
ncbi:indole-3-glycerol-phosphate synthase TrpC [Campylobacter sp. TTU-622]|uniref:indole-3-glycerol-phosphate synthase TrpC n=1 Tax=unclassified Campylobacter TaxID=2593542 RepID=UPI0019054E13|nr:MULTISPECIES: indole-3-glycerol-phosphate synthase TrpC [unclassified Campylobacter]MBK1972947.1 indole-3-glycerol-phosphate synthase TrpC [Campylobacter sp. TTU-622]MBK1991649.1 indole-3-glycerol-phosphate synthase TrpC [Campylobacter sp. 2018MI34]